MSDNALIPVSDIKVMAEAIAKSGLFGMRNPEQALALMLISQAEGRHPAIAARDYYVVQGRPTLKADAILARFQENGGRVEWHEYSDTRAEATFTHPAGGSLRVAWTIEQARAAGLTAKGGPWKQFPRAMLRARLISEAVRTVLPSVICGVYTPEEIEDNAATAPNAPAEPIYVGTAQRVDETPPRRAEPPTATAPTPTETPATEAATTPAPTPAPTKAEPQGEPQAEPAPTATARAPGPAPEGADPRQTAWIDKVIDRAAATGAWKGALDALTGKFGDDADLLRYAKGRLYGAFLKGTVDAAKASGDWGAAEEAIRGFFAADQRALDRALDALSTAFLKKTIDSAKASGDWGAADEGIRAFYAADQRALDEALDALSTAFDQAKEAKAAA